MNSVLRKSILVVCAVLQLGTITMPVRAHRLGSDVAKVIGTFLVYDGLTKGSLNKGKTYIIRQRVYDPAYLCNWEFIQRKSISEINEQKGLLKNQLLDEIYKKMNPYRPHAFVALFPGFFDACFSADETPKLELGATRKKTLKRLQDIIEQEMDELQMFKKLLKPYTQLFTSLEYLSKDVVNSPFLKFFELNALSKAMKVNGVSFEKLSYKDCTAQIVKSIKDNLNLSAYSLVCPAYGYAAETYLDVLIRIKRLEIMYDALTGKDINKVSDAFGDTVREIKVATKEFEDRTYKVNGQQLAYRIQGDPTSQKTTFNYEWLQDLVAKIRKNIDSLVSKLNKKETWQDIDTSTSKLTQAELVNQIRQIRYANQDEKAWPEERNDILTHARNMVIILEAWKDKAATVLGKK